jgi:hypothetical protein
VTAEQALTESEVSQFFSDWSFLTGSVGDYGHKQACTMSAAVALTRVRRGVDMNGATDSLECVCPVIRKLVIARNDATPVADLKPWAVMIIPRIVGTNEGKALSVARAEPLVRYAIRVIAAEAMDSAMLPKIAAKCRSVGENALMSDCRAVAREARDSANKERSARGNAADAAYAAAYAATAYAAAAAADAAYAAAAAAAAAYAATAYAAAATDAAAAARRTAVRLAHLDRMIEDCLAIKGIRR